MIEVGDFIRVGTGNREFLATLLIETLQSDSEKLCLTKMESEIVFSAILPQMITRKGRCKRWQHTCDSTGILCTYMSGGNGLPSDDPPARLLPISLIKISILIVPIINYTNLYL